MLCRSAVNYFASEILSPAGSRADSSRQDSRWVTGEVYALAELCEAIVDCCYRSGGVATSEAIQSGGGRTHTDSEPVGFSQQP